MTDQTENKPCECAAWMRESSPSFMPISDHHPKCRHYQLERYVRVELDGAVCIMTPKEAEEQRKHITPEAPFSDVFMTADQFEKLGEFQGF